MDPRTLQDLRRSLAAAAAAAPPEPQTLGMRLGAVIRSMAQRDRCAPSRTAQRRAPTAARAWPPPAGDEDPDEPIAALILPLDSVLAAFGPRREAFGLRRQGAGPAGPRRPEPTSLQGAAAPPWDAAQAKIGNTAGPTLEDRTQNQGLSAAPGAEHRRRRGDPPTEAGTAPPGAGAASASPVAPAPRRRFAQDAAETPYFDVDLADETALETAASGLSAFGARPAADPAAAPPPVAPQQRPAHDLATQKAIILAHLAAALAAGGEAVTERLLEARQTPPLSMASSPGEA